MCHSLPWSLVDRKLSRTIDGHRELGSWSTHDAIYWGGGKVDPFLLFVEGELELFFLVYKVNNVCIGLFSWEDVVVLKRT